MSYNLQYAHPEHHCLLSETLSSWANNDRDIYMVSSEGHRLYTSQRLLALSSPYLLGTILPSLTDTTGLSLPFSTSSLSVLLGLLATGAANSESYPDKSEVNAAATCLGITLNLVEGLPEEEVANIAVFEARTQNTSFSSSIPEKSVKNSSLLVSASSQSVQNVIVKQEIESNEEGWVGGEEDPLTGNPASFPCDFCDKSYSLKAELRKHKHMKHPGEASVGDIKCNYCPKLLNKNYMTRHVNKKHPGEQAEFPAEQYLEQTLVETNQINDASESDFINEETVADDPPRHPCEFCSKSFVSRIAVRLHKRNIHPNLASAGDIPCKYCDGQFNEKFMFRHVIVKHPEVSNDALKEGDSNEELVNIKIEGVPTTETVAEETDAMEVEDESIGQSSAENTCEFCDKIFSNRSNLRMHKRKQHPTEGGEGDVICKFCPKQFSITKMWRHVRAKHSNLAGEGSEEVETNNTPLNDDLIKNIKMEGVASDVNDDKPRDEDNSDGSQRYPCLFCPKTFGKKNYLRMHKQQIHPGLASVGDIPCNYCPKMFNKDKMSRHVLAKHPEHAEDTIDAPSENSDLKIKVEQMQSENESITKCTLCPKIFASEAYLSKHMMSRHKEELTNQTETETCVEENVGTAEGDLENAEDDPSKLSNDDLSKESNDETCEEVVDNIPDDTIETSDDPIETPDDPIETTDDPIETPDDSSVDTPDVPLVQNDEMDSNEQSLETEAEIEPSEEINETEKEEESN